jgi:Fur family ferric uptake transcriptional regulator
MTLKTSQRQTRQRQIILEELRRSHEHPTAAELHRAVRKRLPRISLGTIYRNLELLANSGQIRKLLLGGKTMRYDSDLGRHYHIRCIGCGRIDDIHAPTLDIERAELESPEGYEILGHRLEFIGVCKDCRRRKKREGKPQAVSFGKRQDR